MEYTIKLTPQQLELLKSIFVQIDPVQFVVTSNVKPKKLTKTEIAHQSILDYRANKALRKRK